MASLEALQAANNARSRAQRVSDREHALTDEGWAVADEMRCTNLPEGNGAARTTHVYAYVSEARDKGFKAAKDEAVSKGLDYREHIDPIGARLSEKQLRSLEEPKRSAGQLKAFFREIRAH